MIRINLLPVRAAKKKESLRLQMTIAGLVVFLVVSVGLAVYFIGRSDAAQVKTRIRDGEQEIEGLKKKIGELSKIKEQKRIVEEKLNIINSLEAARSGPVDLFKMLSTAIPEKAWLLTVKDTGTKIELVGNASNEDVVADFMRGLQKNKEFSAVELDIAQRTTDRETSADVVGFTIRVERAAR